MARWKPPTADLAPRLTPAWQTLLEQLADGLWHSRRELVDAMVEASDILPTTCSDLIRNGNKAGIIHSRRSGKHYSDKLALVG